MTAYTYYNNRRKIYEAIYIPTNVNTIMFTSHQTINVYYFFVNIRVGQYDNWNFVGVLTLTSSEASWASFPYEGI